MKLPDWETIVEHKVQQKIISKKPLSGGDINEAFEVKFESGENYFLKTNPLAPEGMFEAEAKGLKWLKENETIRIPNVIAYNQADEPPYLMLEMIQSAKRSRDFDERLGQGLANLHKTGADHFGLDHNNFIGTLPQTNTPTDDWIEFFVLHRLEAQLRLAVDQKKLESDFRTRFKRLIQNIESFIGNTEPQSRLHGDLWGGNLHVDERGHPCLIDPAVYGGHREVDLAMMDLFGGFSAQVLLTYAEHFPLEAELETRIALYQLYPVLVHLNLFSSTYLHMLDEHLKRLKL